MNVQTPNIICTDILSDEHFSIDVDIPPKYKGDFKILRSKEQRKVDKDVKKRTNKFGKANLPKPKPSVSMVSEVHDIYPTLKQREAPQLEIYVSSV